MVLNRRKKAMSQKHMMTPFQGILVCINTIIGAGIFINAKPLTILAGPFGFFGYVLAGLALLPLVISIGQVASVHPVAGGMYVYGKESFGRLVGFIGGWSYFLGKLTSLSLLTHKFMEFFYIRFASLQVVPLILLDFFMLFFMAFLYMGGVNLGGRIQYVFALLKLIPLFFAIVCGFLYFDATVFITSQPNVSGLFSSVSIAVFSLVGFEIICSVGNHLQDGSKNMQRVIASSFLFVLLINILFQAAAYIIVGDNLALTNEPLLAMGIMVMPAFLILAKMLNAMVFVAIIGSAFSMLTSNSWNLYTLAKDGHFPNKKLLTTMGNNQVPWVSLFFEVLLGCFIVWVTSEQIPLQNMAVLGIVTAYLVSACAAFKIMSGKNATIASRSVQLLGVIGALYVVGLAFLRLIESGISFPFFGIFLFGLVCAFVRSYKRGGYQ